jgi:hypothetical protein
MFIQFDIQDSYDDKTKTPYRLKISFESLQKFEFYRNLIADLDIVCDDEDVELTYTFKDPFDNAPCKYVFDFILDICNFVDEKNSVDENTLRDFQAYIDNEENQTELADKVSTIIDTYNEKYNIDKIKLLNDSCICANSVVCDNNIPGKSPIIFEILCFYYAKLLRDKQTPVE